MIGTGDEGSVLIGAINPEFIEVEGHRRHPPLQRLPGVPRRPLQPDGHARSAAG